MIMATPAPIAMTEMNRDDPNAVVNSMNKVVIKGTPWNCSEVCFFEFLEFSFVHETDCLPVIRHD